MVQEVKQYLASLSIITDEDKLTELSDRCEPSASSLSSGKNLISRLRILSKFVVSSACSYVAISQSIRWSTNLMLSKV